MIHFFHFKLSNSVFFKAISEKKFSFEQAKELDRLNERRPNCNIEYNVANLNNNNILNNSNSETVTFPNNKSVNSLNKTENTNPSIEISTSNHNNDDASTTNNANTIDLRLKQILITEKSKDTEIEIDKNNSIQINLEEVNLGILTNNTNNNEVKESVVLPITINTASK